MVEGGQAALVKAICDVTSNVSEYPADLAPYAGFLFGRLAARADLPKAGMTALTVFVEIDRDPDHVKLFKSGTESAKQALNGADKTVSKQPRPAEERAILEESGMEWVEQVALRGAMAMGIVLSREQIHELGHEGDPLDSHQFKQLVKTQRPWYMTYVRANDAKGLKSWLKRSVNALTVSKYSKASACLNLLIDELAELTIDQNFPRGFIDYYSEHMELRRRALVKADAPIDDAILRRKVTGVRQQPSNVMAEEEESRRKRAEETMLKMASKIDSLEAQLRNLKSIQKPVGGADPRPNDANRCYECGEVGHFGRDCPKRAAKDKRESEAAAEAAKSAADLEKK